MRLLTFLRGITLWIQVYCSLETQECGVDAGDLCIHSFAASLKPSEASHRWGPYEYRASLGPLTSHNVTTDIPGHIAPALDVI